MIINSEREREKKYRRLWPIIGFSNLLSLQHFEGDLGLQTIQYENSFWRERSHQSTTYVPVTIRRVACSQQHTTKTCLEFNLQHQIGFTFKCIVSKFSYIKIHQTLSIDRAILVHYSLIDIKFTYGRPRNCKFGHKN